MSKVSFRKEIMSALYKNKVQIIGQIQVVILNPFQMVGPGLASPDYQLDYLDILPLLVITISNTHSQSSFFTLHRISSTILITFK